MKMRCFILVTAAAVLGGPLFGGEVVLDDHFFTVIAAALDVPDEQTWKTLSMDQKRTNAEALYFLDLKASQTGGLSDGVRLTVAASAIESFSRYLPAALSTSTMREHFANSSNAIEALFLLEDSVKTRARIPIRRPYSNLAPPLDTNAAHPGAESGIGIAISGMDPKDVLDPKARAEYERSLAQNQRVVDEWNARARITTGIKYLIMAMQRQMKILDLTGNGGALRAEIGASSLPKEVKAEILGQE